MTTEKQEKIALFRYGIIFPLLDERLERGEKEKLLEGITTRSYEIPFSTRTVIARGTVLGWLRQYKKGKSVDALQPKIRKDNGSTRALTEIEAADLRKLRKEHPETPLTVLVRNAQRDGVIAARGKIPMSSVYRMFREWEETPETEKDRRRFEMESCNDLWMLDAMTGPLVTIESEGRAKTVRAKCFAFIDDRSRLITHAEFYQDETAESLLDCMWKAFNKRGLPRKIFTDNGSAMKDTRLAMGLAELEISLSYAKPYSPQGKAKLERFWRTLRMQFLSLLPTDGSITLFELNRRLAKYIDEYNNRYHSGIGMSPMERYASDVVAIRMAPMDLPSHFRRKAERKVTLARTISIDGHCFQVPLGYAGKKIEARFMSIDGMIELFYEGEKIGNAEPLDLIANGRAHRQEGER